MRGIGWAANSVVPTTTLAAETGNNTSSSSTFTTQSNGNIGQANVSKVPSITLLYAGANTPIYAHFMAWFGGSNHMNVGYASNDPTQVHRQVNDMLSRGIHGAIIDWYGPNHTRENETTQYMMQEAQSRGGAYFFAVMYDGGALSTCAATAGCDLTNQAISDLTYAYNTYETSPAYLRRSGRPLVFFFSPDRYGTLDWSTIAASVPGNPIFIFRNSSGFTHAESGGSFSWVGLNTSDPSDMGLSYFDNFYLTSLSYPQDVTVGSGNKGFNDSLAAWSPSSGPRIQYQQCGQTWLDTLAQAGNYFSTAHQLEAMQFVTWNDYEEGTEIETGIDNCVTVNASVSGNMLSWGITGSLNTIDHFTIFISSDGTNLMSLGDQPAGATSYDLSQANMEAGSYIVFVKAVGRPSLTNKMSAGATFNVAGSQPPATSASVVVQPPAQTVGSGQTATYTVSIAPMSGVAANSTVSLSCSNLPPSTACSFSPASYAQSSTTATSTLKIATNVSSLARLPMGRNGFWAAAVLGIPAMGLVGMIGVRRRKRWWIAFAMLVALWLAGGCAGGAYNPNTVAASTPAGAYTVKVTASAGSVQQSSSVMLIVQ